MYLVIFNTEKSILEANQLLIKSSNSLQLSKVVDKMKK